MLNVKVKKTESFKHIMGIILNKKLTYRYSFLDKNSVHVVLGEEYGDFRHDSDYFMRAATKMFSEVEDLNCQFVVLDLKHVSYLSHENLWPIFKFFKALEENGKKLILVNMKDQPKRKVLITKLDTKVGILDSLDEAIAHIKEQYFAES